MEDFTWVGERMGMRMRRRIPVRLHGACMCEQVRSRVTGEGEPPVALCEGLFQSRGFISRDTCSPSRASLIRLQDGCVPSWRIFLGRLTLSRSHPDEQGFAKLEGARMSLIRGDGNTGQRQC